jgi:pimeloyl-ACP methyl ester carboxylesterase
LSALVRRAWPVAVRLAVQHPVTDWLAARSLWRNDDDLAKATFESAMGGLRAMTHYDLSDVLASIRAPTLVVVGERDLVVAPAEGRLAAGRIAGARLVALRAGHRPFEERPAEFMSALVSFLAAGGQAAA